MFRVAVGPLACDGIGSRTERGDARDRGLVEDELRAVGGPLGDGVVGEVPLDPIKQTFDRGQVPTIAGREVVDDTDLAALG